MMENNEVTSEQLQVVGDEVVNKLITMQDIVTAIQLDQTDNSLADNVRRFKLMMVKKSLTDIMMMVQLKDTVQAELVKKVTEDIGMYPLTAQLDILGAMNKLIDRDLQIMESVIPRAESLAEFLERTSKPVVINQQVNLDGFTPTQLERVMQIVESVINQINKKTDNSGGTSNGTN